MNQPQPSIEAAKVQEQEKEMLLDLLWELVERLSAILDIPPNIPAGVKGVTQ